LRYKLQNLKSVVNSTQIDQVQNASISEVNLSNDFKNTTDNLKAPQCGPADDLNASQNEHQTAINDLKSSQTSSFSTLVSTLDNLKTSHDQLSKSLTGLKADMDMSIDAKLKLVESRLMNKIDEKFNKILKVLNVEN